MARETRSQTGHSKPRIFEKIENAVAPKKRTTTTSRTKANTSKPRANKVASGRVGKPKTTTTTTTTTKRTTTTGKKGAAGTNVKTVKKPRTKTEKVKDEISGTVEKIVGDVEGRPGKKAAGTAKKRGTDSTTKRAVPRAKKV